MEKNKPDCKDVYNLKQEIGNKINSFKLLITILLIYLIARILSIFFMGNVFDLPEYSNMGLQLLIGQNPYTATYPYGWNSNKYPPFNFVLYSLITFLAGNNLVAMHLLPLIFDLLSIFMVYKISKHLWNQKTAQFTVILYLTNAFILSQLILGANDFIVVFFILSTTYFFLVGKRNLSGLFMGIGIMVKFVPIILFFPICLNMIKSSLDNQKIMWSRLLKQILLYFIPVLTSISLILIPFMISDLNSILGSMLQFLSEGSASMTYAPLFQILFDIKINILGIIDLSLFFLMELIFLFGLFLVFVKRIDSFSKTNFLLITIIVFIFIGIFSCNLIPRNLLWIQALLLIWISGKNSESINIFFENLYRKPNSFQGSIRKWKPGILSYGIFTIGLIFLLIIGFIYIFNINVFGPPNQLLLLNWAIHPENRGMTRLYFNLFNIFFLILIICSYLMIGQFISRRYNNLIILGSFYSLNSWSFFMILDLNYAEVLNYIDNFILDPWSLILTLSSIAFAYYINIKLLKVLIQELFTKNKDFQLNIKALIRKFYLLIKKRIFEYDIENSAKGVSSENIQNYENSVEGIKSNIISFFIRIISFLKIIAIPLILRLIVIWFPYNPGDNAICYTSGLAILQGYIPFRDFGINPYLFIGWDTHPHPPLFYYLNVIPVFFAGGNEFLSGIFYKIFWLVLEIFTMYFIYRISLRFIDIRRTQILILLYGIIPSTFYVVGFIGIQEASAAAFISGGLFEYLEKRRYWLSSVLFGLSFMDSVFGLFIYIILLISLLFNKKVVNALRFLVGFFSVIIMMSIPFLIICPVEYMQFIQRIAIYNTSFSLGPYIFESFFEFPLLNLGIPFISGLSIQISIKFVYIIVGLLSIYAIPYFIVNKKKSFSRNTSDTLIILSIALFQLFMPLLFRSVHFRLIFWSFPYLLLYIFTQFKIEIQFKEILKKYIVIMFLSFICVYIGFLSYIFLINIAALENRLYYHHTFVWYLIFHIVWYLLYEITLHIRKNNGDRSKKNTLTYINRHFFVFSVCTYLNFDISLGFVPDIFGYFSVVALIISTIITAIKIFKFNLYEQFNSINLDDNKEGNP